MKVLVTGGTGYIGSHTVIALQNIGFEPIVVDNLSNSDDSVLDRISDITGKKPVFEKVDLCDPARTAAVFKKHAPISGVIHFAAFKAVGESVKEPLNYYENNLLSLIHLIRIMSQYDCPSLIFSSSCTVYGQPEILPVTEESPILPAESPYGNTKQIGEEIIQDAIGAGYLSSCISLRYFNPVGAHDSALIGELPLGTPANLMPFITQTAFGIRDSLKVFGSDYATPDGTAIRDYIHVMDLAEAHVVALQRLQQESHLSDFEVFNLGTGRGTSVLEMIRAFELSTGVKLNYELVDRRAGDIEQIYADTSKAAKELGWSAKKGLKEMTYSAWEWEKYYRNHLI